MGTCTRERELLGPASLEKSFTVSMGEDDKMSDIDRKKAEVRARLEAQAAGKKAKKGFMTPERKKKLRLLVRKKAAEELKKEQERKAQERRKVINERCGQPKDLDSATENKLIDICKEYFDRMYLCESQKYDMEFEVRKRDFEVPNPGKRPLYIQEQSSAAPAHFFST